MTCDCPPRRAVLVSAFGLGLSTLLGKERSSSAAERVALAVLVAKESSVKELRLIELRRIFLRLDDSNTSDKTVIPFNFPAGTLERVEFDRRVLKMDPDDVGRYWVDRKIRGLPGPPRTVPSANLLERLVAALPNSIGYVRASTVTGAARILRIDGKLPSDPGYPISFDE